MGNIAQINLEEQMKLFWELEEIPQQAALLTQEEARCEEFYKKTTKHTTTGRYIVRLPFKNNDKPDLGSSRKMAIATLVHMEK